MSDFKEILKKWAEALESDKYIQTTSFLKTEEEDGSNRYCCIGVLAEKVLDMEIKEAFYNEDVDDLVEDNVDVYKDIRLLFVKHKSYAMDTYITMNDELEATFKEIAEQIRKDFGLTDQK